MYEALSYSCMRLKLLVYDSRVSSHMFVFLRTPRNLTDFGRDHTRMTVCTIPTACCMFSQHIAIPNSCLPCLRSLSLLQEPRHFSPDEGGKSFESLFISLDMRRRALDRQFVRTKICGMYVCKMYINIQ